ncbi:hypothetical protein P389DRAFT_198205 [Cystobasidium minutum MCA 4210]|uniref:uncharacterized protein n=1 Tax=Cystobasidium minutum MCA 4210 TaxID=1397322 RepID=UPI0034CF1A11|eukprot:jgi/Rhomi1/198205/gm1.6419_g
MSATLKSTMSATFKAGQAVIHLQRPLMEEKQQEEEETVRRKEGMKEGKGDFSRPSSLSSFCPPSFFFSWGPTDHEVGDDHDTDDSLDDFNDSSCAPTKNLANAVKIDLLPADGRRVAANGVRFRLQTGLQAAHWTTSTIPTSKLRYDSTTDSDFTTTFDASHAP